MSITDTVVDGPFILAAGLSLAAGVVSFASPCVVPLVPGYLSYLAGLVGAETNDLVRRPTSGSTPSPVQAALTELGPAGAVAGAGAGAGTARTTRRRVSGRAVAATGLFVAGFTLVFLVQTMVVFGLANTLTENRTLLATIGGAVTIVMGLVMLGFIRPMQREWRLHLRPTGRILGAPLLGVTFGLGWVVCIGPALTGVISLTIASDWNSYAWRGLFLVIFYCLGLGLPFMLLAIGFSWAGTGLSFLRKHSRRIQVIGASMLILLGLLMVTGLWTDLVSWLSGLYADTRTVL